MNMNMLLASAANAGLGDLQKTLVSNWIGPAFFIVVAGFAIKFIVSRQFRELAGFLGIAAIVALLIFNAGGLFGTDGVFYKIANSFSDGLTSGGSSTGSGGSGGMINILQHFRL